jgi:hypothetical protein
MGFAPLFQLFYLLNFHALLTCDGVHLFPHLRLFCLTHRFRKDCELLAGFVHRIEHFITETEDDTDMTGPGWEAAFSVSGA